MIKSRRRSSLGAVALVGVAVWLGGLVAGVAFEAAAQPLDNLNSNAEVPKVAWRSPSAELAHLVAAGVPVQVEDRLGVPSAWVVGPGWFRAPSAGVSPEAAAVGYLEQLAPLYRLPASALPALELERSHDAGRGPIIVRFRQRLDGVEVYGLQLNLVMDRSLRLVGVTGWLHPDVAELTATGRFVRVVGVEEALGEALLDMEGTFAAPWDWKETGARSGEFGIFEVGASLQSRAGVRVDPVRARPVWFSTPSGLVPAWHLELIAGPRGEPTEAYAYIISARDGRLLLRQSLDADVSWRVWADPDTGLPQDSPQGSEASPFRDPQPGPDAFVAASLVDASPGLFGQGDPWLPPQMSETRGNNVDAYVDRSGGDGFDAQDYRATPTGAGRFEHVYDPTQHPAVSTEQVMASVQSLFFVNNALHNLYYAHGFDERAGNAQASNLGRGGLESDVLLAEAQDFEGVDNANMRTPSDGASPRMQMYLFPSGRRWTLDWTAGAGAPRAVGRAGLPQFWPQTGGAEGPVVQAGGACIALNPGSLMGSVGLLDRGVCTFFEKLVNAQAAGAVAAIIVNNDTANPDAVLHMNLADGQSPDLITIPSIMVSWREGEAIKAALRSGAVGATLALGTVPDGTLDNQIVAHEWGHYMFGRLTRGASNQQGAGLNEGNSDVVALLVALRAEDALVAGNEDWGGVWPFAAYASGHPYFGLRRYPYAVDLGVNPLTFRHIANDQPLPPSGEVPRRDTAPDNAEVHNAGEVWAAAMWEGIVAVLRAHPFEEARARLLTMLVASLKATPTDTTFVEARDAVLAALAATDVDDLVRFAEAFARRGLGTGARAPERFSLDNTGSVESFELKPDVAVLGVTLREVGVSCDGDGMLDLGEDGELVIDLANVGYGGMSATTITASGLGLDFPSGPRVSPGTIAPLGRAQAIIPVHLSAAPTGMVSVQLDIADPQLAAPTTRTARVDVRVDFDESVAVTATDDVEAWSTTWTASSDGPAAEGWERTGDGSGGRLWRGPDASRRADITLTSPPLQVSTTADFGFSFRHRHAFDEGADPNVVQGPIYFDGGVIELSADGQSWTDIGALAAPGYTGRIVDLAAIYGLPPAQNNPLVGRMTFAGSSAGYPGFVPVRIDLGRSWAGQQVQVRFRIGTDPATGSAGWELDDIAFRGITNTPFATNGPNRGICRDAPPMADPGPDFAVDEGQHTTLNGAASSDPWGEPLAFAWTQTDGPDVVLTGDDTASPSFEAPLVLADTTVRFALVVTAAGRVSAPAAVAVAIHDLNRRPTANAGRDQRVEERTQITLDGSASADPDGDPLRWSWSQVDGPAVALDLAAPARPTFVAPEVTTDSPLIFALTVDDGVLDSALSDEVVVTVLQVNRPPIADAGPELEVPEQSLVMLDGRASRDPDGDAITTYAWRQTSGTAVVLDHADAATPTFEAPSVAEDIRLTFALEVSDGALTSAPATVDVLVRSHNTAPMAVAGVAQAVDEGDAVTLDGTASTDADGDALTYRWTQTAGPAVTVDAASAPTVTWTAPLVSADVQLSFELVVSDGELDSLPAVVSITVRNVNHGPIANAGADITVPPGSDVVLDGSASSDQDADPLTWDWVQLAGPTVDLASARSPHPAFVAPSVRQATELLFSLVVTDGELASPSSEVRVTVAGANLAPLVVAGPDRFAEAGDLITLDGSATVDPEGDAITFGWTQLDGAPVALSDQDAAVTTFVAPEVDQDALLRFELTATDDLGASAAATVTITVRKTVRPSTNNGGTNNGGTNDGGTNNGAVGNNATNNGVPDNGPEPGPPVAKSPDGCACTTSSGAVPGRGWLAILALGAALALRRLR